MIRPLHGTYEWWECRPAGEARSEARDTQPAGADTRPVAELDGVEKVLTTRGPARVSGTTCLHEVGVRCQLDSGRVELGDPLTFIATGIRRSPLNWRTVQGVVHQLVARIESGAVAKVRID